MRAARPAAALLGAGLLAAAQLRPAGPIEPNAPSPSIDAANDAEIVADFHLSDAGGRRVGLWSNARAFTVQVIGVVAARAPDRSATIRRLSAIARERGDRVRVLILDSRDENGTDGDALDRPLPEGAFLLEDPFGIATRRMGFAHDGDVLVVDRDLKPVWRGAARGRDEAAAAESSALLLKVVDAVLAGAAPPADPAAEPLASGATALPLEAPARRVTWFGDLLPVVRAQCSECHRRDGIGPMDLTDLDEARGWAPMMAEVTASGVMPPWSADPRFAVCRNERRLTDTEKELFRRFAEQGAPAGDPPKEGDASKTGAAGPPKTFAPPVDGVAWTIGTPDVIWELPQPQVIPAEGVLEYRSALIKPGLPEEAWIEAFECRPTALQNTHHIVAILVPNEVSDEEAATLSTTFPDAVIGGYVPGAPAVWFPQGCARRLKKGQRLVLSIHYTTNGKAAVDRTRVGVRFARGTVEHEVHGAMLATQQIDLPPGASHVQCYAVQKIEKPIEILNFQVHMHARGVGFRYDVLHDGAMRTLFDIPRFDWYWQHFYDLATPIRVEAGDVLGGIATYDNSAANPRNPDPTARVKNGPQSWNEMMNGYYQYIDAAPGPKSGK